MSTMPRFSVVICNYNYARFVGDAIQSALQQVYPRELLQVIAVDDGSTDGSEAVYSRFAQDPCFLLVRQENRGHTAAFETGVRQATGDFVCLLDSDDYFLPGKLQRLARHIDTLGEAPDNLFLCHDLVVMDTTGELAAEDSPSWFARVGISQMPDCAPIEHPVKYFPFSIPCGLVFSRAVISQIVATLPTWAFRKEGDGIFCPAALIKTGRVHYLRESLGVYRIHGGNDFASLVNGQYVPRWDPSASAPRKVRFLEQWIDALDQPGGQRAQSLDYLRRFEHINRRPSASREFSAVAVSVVMLSRANVDSEMAELPATSGVNGANASLQSHPEVRFIAPADARSTELVQMANGYLASRSEYVVFLRSGDRLDREFVECHLHARQHAALVGVSCSDIRLASRQGSLVHADVMRNSGAWKQALQQVPPLATGLKDWVTTPSCACLFRRTALLDAFFAQAQSLPLQLQHAGFWLAFQLQHHTGGVLRILDTLSTHQLPDGAAASYGYLSAPSDLQGRLYSPPIAQAMQWFTEFYAKERTLFNDHLPAAWHQRFSSWLRAQMPAAAPTNSGAA